MTETCTTCPYCGVGCGVVATVTGDGPDRDVSVRGDPDHPANFGRLCSKGSALAETLGMETRLLYPEIDGERVFWETAITAVAEGFKKTIAQHGPDSVAFYVSGQLLTEDYYIANKLMKGFIGSANIDTNSRLCMASSVAGHKRAFGTDTVPGTYEDLELADLVVITGSNMAWCHPVLYQRVLAAKEARPEMKIVVIDPRRTATCDGADLHLQVTPGRDVALFNTLLAEIARRDAVTDYATLVSGLDTAIAAAEADAGIDTGITAEELATFHDLFIGTEKVVTLYSQGVNQAVDGTDKVNAILNCHLATGRIGRPGMGPFSLTGQPNAMGGREVGGLANMLACHLDIDNPEHSAAVQSFWDAPTMPRANGLRAVDMFDAVADGRIKAIWIMSTNPVVSMPEADKVAEALRNCPLVVVSDIEARTDTGDLAHIRLPATGWGEKSGMVTNSDRTMSRQRPFLPVPGEARPDWKTLCDVGIAMGWGKAFDFASEAEVFAEFAAMSALSRDLGKDFDITGAAEMDYAAWSPTRWPIHPGATERFFADGRFYHADGKAKALAVRQGLPDAPQGSLRLNTGRIRDQWHTMTRTAKTPRLAAHLAEPFVEIHPTDAERLGILPAHLVEVSNRFGTAILRALVTDRVTPGEVFAPMHWTRQFSSAGRINAAVAAETDPVSGQPALKGSHASLTPFPARWYGFAVSRRPFAGKTPYWAKAPVAGGWQVECAGMSNETPERIAATLLGDIGDAAASYDVPRGQSARLWLDDNGCLEAAIFIAPHPVALARAFVATALGAAVDARLLSGRPGRDIPDPGATICSCYGVGINTILAAIATGDETVEALGQSLQAGTNCGSCRPELRALIASHSLKMAAE